MSQAVQVRRTSGAKRTDEPVVDGDVEELLTALEDADCRAVLEATGEEALSAAELGDCCDIPSSTVYRKVEQLTEAGLLEEQLRVRRSGKHTREYRRAVDQLSLTIGSEGTELRADASANGAPQAAD
jgi:DNA-binding transcriptional ArsR family regulator